MPMRIWAKCLSSFTFYSQVSLIDRSNDAYFSHGSIILELQSVLDQFKLDSESLFVNEVTDADEEAKDERPSAFSQFGYFD